MNSEPFNPFNPSNQSQFQSRLATLDLDPKIQPQNWIGEQWQDAIIYYKMFLSLAYLYPHLTLIPTQKIDQVWHCHLSNPEQYQTDCQKLFGYTIDHVVTHSSSDRSLLSTAFATTQTLLTQHFGLTFSERSEDDPGACMIPGRG
jgi:hypothetical protein